MTQDSVLRLHLPGILIVIALGTSVLLFWLLPPDRIARTLFFPGTTELVLTGERRLVPRVRDQERAIELTVEELLLGPTVISHGRVFAKGTKLQALVLDGKTAYVDLNETAMLESTDVRIGVDLGIEALRETLAYNFRSLDDVVVTIDGNVPFAPAFRE